MQLHRVWILKDKPGKELAIESVKFAAKLPKK